MAFPTTPLDVRVELQVGSTAARCGAVAGGTSLDSGGYVHTPDASALGITGDIDIRIDLACLDWTPGVELALAAKYDTSGDNRSWYLRLTTAGELELNTSPDGTFGAIVTGTSTAAVGAANGARKAVRATLDVVSGGNRVYTFYTADSISGSWVQLGSTVTTAGTTSVFDGTADVSIGTAHGGAAAVGGVGPLAGQVYAFELYSGIGGTRVAAVDFTTANPRRVWEGVQRVEGVLGETWYVEGSSVLVRGWTDVTADVLARGELGISRGLPNEKGAAVAPPASASYELDNRTGNYSPRKAASPYYGLLGRNTPTRASVPGAARLTLPRPVDDYAYCYDSAGLSVTGDIDLRIDLDVSSWVGLGAILIAKHLEGSGQSSYMLLLDGTGYLWLYWSADGTNNLTAQSTSPVPGPYYGRKAVRATLDVVSGANKAVTFYTADDMDSSWVQLGSAVTTAGNTSIFNGSAECRVMGWSSGWPGGAYAEVYEVQVRNGIGGSLVGNPDFTAGTAGARTLTDAQGNVWQLTGTAEITDRDYRFHGEVADFPPRWDETGNAAWVPVDAAGIRRRLDQGTAPVRSAYYRGFTRLEDNISLGGVALDGRVALYFPCEDAEGATAFSSATPGVSPVTPAGEPDFAAFSGFDCSEALPYIRSSTFGGPIPAYSDADREFQMWFLLAVPSGGTGGEYTVCRLFEAGGSDTALWQLFVSAAGSLRLMAFDLGLSTIVDTGLQAFGVNGALRRVSISLSQNGTAVDYAIHTRDATTGAGLAHTGSLASATLGRFTRWDFGHELNLDDVAVGHVTMHNLVLDNGDFSLELEAFKGEAAAERTRRLCAEEGVEYTTVGDQIDTVPMGPQRPGKLLDLIDEAASADMGFLYAPRRFMGFAYRTRASLYNQAAALELDYATGHLSPPLEPTTDDRGLGNDVTVRREGGGRFHKVAYDGAGLGLEVVSVGRYDGGGTTVNVEADSQLGDQAGWRLRVGTAGGYRYPSVAVALERPAFVASGALTAAVRALDVGGRLTVDGLPAAFLPPEEADQLALGFAETIGAFTHAFRFNCVSSAPWTVGVWGSARYSPEGSRLGAGVTSGATSLTVRSTGGVVWDDTDQPYDVVVGGEVMTVTAVSGASSPQTFTVTRSVNGVAKSHAEGAPVELAAPSHYAL